MKLDEGQHLVGVSICNAGQDVFLTTALGRCIRFEVEDVRVFAGRDSTGVRGIRLAESDEVISMAILRHVEATAVERAAYLRYAAQQRAARGEAEDAEGEIAEAVEIEAEEGVDVAAEGEVGHDRLIQLEAADQLILTVTQSGLGKRTSAYDYRVTGRGGQGLTAYNLGRLAGGRLAASFPIEVDDEILLVTDQGQLIRTPVGQVRIAARATGGVFILRTGQGERVVSVERLEAEAPGEGEGEAGPETSEA